jgi:cytidine deaminase
MWLCKSKTGATSRINLEWAQFKTTSKASQSALACMWMEQGFKALSLVECLGSMHDEELLYYCE